jgi:hypothetical protein
LPPVVAKVLRRSALALVFVTGIVYVADFLSVWGRARHATATDPYETLTAPRILAISENGGKTEFQLDAQNPEQKVTCVHSLFPHDGYATCWQTQRTLHKPIPM